MLGVHLYFVKLFGCDIIEAGVPIEIAPFAQSILKGKPHPDIYLEFGYMHCSRSMPLAGRTDLHGEKRVDGKCICAAWMYYLDQAAVVVMFAALGEHREGMRTSWHPRYGTNKLRLANFTLR